MGDKVYDDEYIANLLKKDAKQATKKYELVGMDAFNPRRVNSGAPKPNTNFLRHIIRQTDSHNAALLAKEAEDSNARLRSMDRERIKARLRDEDRKQKKIEGRLTPVPSDRDARSRQSKHSRHSSDSDSQPHRKRKRQDRDERWDARSRRHGESTKDMKRRERSHQDSEEERSMRHSRHSRSHHYSGQQRKNSNEEKNERRSKKHSSDYKHRRRRSCSRSSARSHSPRRDHYEARRNQKQSQPLKSSRNDHRKSTHRSPSQTSDSDPLEAIVGPLPPSAQPTVHSRGRGAHKAGSMGIESRFSSTYDPSIDVRANSDAEDNWGDAIEAFRDRQKWKQQGADRLKAAGFTDDQVKKWERGADPNEDDVVWTREGQAREWDRGKVVDDEGDVELKADFGRLK